MQHDLIIVGGGLVGLSLALALRGTPYSIGLIERQSPQLQDARLFALNHASVTFLKTLNVWDSVAQEAAPIHEVHVSRKGHFGSVRLSRNDLKLDTLGYLIPARHIEKALNEVILKLSHCTVYRPATVQTIARQAENITLHCKAEEGEKVLRGTCLIGADGSDSVVRGMMHIQTEEKVLQQIAIVTHIYLSKPHQFVAFERFTNDGTLALLPMKATKEDEALARFPVATILTTSKNEAQQLLDMSEENFRQALQEAFGFRLGKFIHTGMRFTYPLRHLRAEQTNLSNVILLGNAAHTISPVAAQGFNLALWEVACLAKMLKEHDHHPHDLATLAPQFNQYIAKHQSTAINFTARLTDMVHGPLHQWTPSVLSIGMVAFNLLPPLKRRFLKQMMGISSFLSAANHR
ncbi:MAG: FAD-dependent monooxygenase [Gammaproteobacteria bacterium]|nr:FAD-dependent monooxygenase [Gammaproteobacteria bacterium]